LADQLHEVCETMKNEETGLLVQGLESLQKELLVAPLQKMKPSALQVDENKSISQHSHSREVSHPIF
jgi:hypothetical protein